MSRNALITLILILLFSGLLAAQSASGGSTEQVGTSVANILKVGVGARSLAMGGASVADCNDISAMYWNVGALAAIEKNQILFHQANWLVDSKIYYLGVGFNLPSIGTFGLSLHYFTSGEMEETTLQNPDGTGRTFSTYDFVLGLSYSRQITNRFSVGLTVKMIEESLDREKARTVSIDMGSLFVTNFLNNMRIGMSLSNLGGKMQFRGSDLSVQYSPNSGYPTKITQASLDTDEWELPLYFRFGLATEAYENDEMRFTVSGEVMDSRDYIHRFAFGGEFGWKEMVFLRGGYQFNSDEDGFSVGGGLKFGFDWADIIIDYAYTDLGVFNNTQRFSIIFGF